MTIAEFANPGEFGDNGPVHCHLNSGLDYDYADAAPGMSVEFVPVAGAGPNGLPAVRFAARREMTDELITSSMPDDEFSILHHGERFHRPRGASWVRRGKAFDPVLDLSERQAFGLWVHGDARGEWFNLQTRGLGRLSGFSDHYIPIDFTGWRYFELIEPECDRFDACSWPYGRAVYKLHRHGTEYDSVTAVHVWLNTVAVGDGVEVMLSPIRALPVLANRLCQPTLTINGETVQFPVELASGSRLEVADGRGIVFGPRGERLTDFRLPASVPGLREGSNSLTFGCESALPRPRARISLVTRDDVAVGGV